MARLISFATIITIVLICVLAEEERYNDQFDYIDPVAILQNDKMRLQYYNCFMGIEPCKTADAKYFKEVFSEAFVTQCKKCTEKQKNTLDMIVDWYTKNDPENWQRIVAKALDDMKQKNAGQ